LRDYFSQEMGKSLIPDRYIDIFQGRAPRGILAKHYTPQELRLLKEIYDKANLKKESNSELPTSPYDLRMKNESGFTLLPERSFDYSTTLREFVRIKNVVKAGILVVASGMLQLQTLLTAFTYSLFY
jgi:hypothetical protein